MDMTVSLAGERQVGRVINGRLVLPLIPFKIGSELILEKRKEGYYLKPDYWFLSGEFYYYIQHSSVPGMPANRDIYLNVLNIWLEWNLGSKWTLLLRQEGKYSLGLEGGLLGRGWLMVGDHFPPLTLGLVRKW